MMVENVLGIVIYGAIGVMGFLGICWLILWYADKREHERNYKEMQARDLKESLFNDWLNRLKACYGKIEGHIRYGENYDPQTQYESIWVLENDCPPYDDRCEEKIKTLYKNHIDWMIGFFKNHIYSPGYFAIPTCTSILRCLREANHYDTSFDRSIEILEKLYNSAGRVEIYLEFTQYGECLLGVDELKKAGTLDVRIGMLEKKLQLLESSISYEKLASNLSDFVDGSAELMWCIAAKKPFDQYAFDKTAERFDRFTARCFDRNGMSSYNPVSEPDSYIKLYHVEHLLALLYAKNQMGGPNLVKQEEEKIMNWLDNAISWRLYDMVLLLPSGLAWMGLYELEREALHRLVERRVNLESELQNRLGFLESGGTSNIKIYDVRAKKGFLYDAGASDWNSDAFELLFRKLEITHTVLQYSLALSKWTKTLPLASGQKISQMQIEQEFAELVDDFDGEVTVSKERAIAINLANVEYESSFIFRFNSERNRCVSVLFASEKYGRNLNITIITMFTPENGLGNEELKKYALAIKENLYVKSFIESVLQAVDNVIKEKQVIYDEEPAKKIFS